MNIGANIKNLRTSFGLTQKQLAEQIHVDQSMICQIERGTKMLTLPLAVEIAHAFQCTLDDLVK